MKAPGSFCNLLLQLHPPESFSIFFVLRDLLALLDILMEFGLLGSRGLYLVVSSGDSAKRLTEPFLATDFSSFYLAKIKWGNHDLGNSPSTLLDVWVPARQ